MIEDLFLAFYLALLQPVLGGASGPLEAAVGIGTAFGFLLLLSVVARFGTRWVSRLVDTRDEEIVVVLALGLAISTAGIGEHLGVSDAIGAFMIGLILSATPIAKRLRSLTHPLRDGFGAIFFFHFGLTIDLGDVVTVVPQVLLAAGTTVLLAVAAGVVAARLHGFGRAQAANIGLTVLSRGEFSLVLASLALAAGLDPRIGSFAAGYVLVLAVLGPAAVSSSGRLARLIPRRLVPGTAERAGPRTAPCRWTWTSGRRPCTNWAPICCRCRVLPGSRLHGVYLNELRLPPGATPGLVSRERQHLRRRAGDPAADARRAARLHRSAPAAGHRAADPRGAPQRPAGLLARRHRQLIVSAAAPAARRRRSRSRWYQATSCQRPCFQPTRR